MRKAGVLGTDGEKKARERLKGGRNREGENCSTVFIWFPGRGEAVRALTGTEDKNGLKNRRLNRSEKRR
jgi:hypothetical protein